MSAAPIEIPPPPPIPLDRRVRALGRRAWVGVVWLIAAGGAAWLYVSGAAGGQAMAYADFTEVHVTPEVPGRIATLSVEVGQEIKEGQLIATLDPKDVDERIHIQKEAVGRIEKRVDAQLVRMQKAVVKGTEHAPLCDADPQRLRMELDRLNGDQATDLGELEAVRIQIARLEGLAAQHLVTGERAEELRVREAMLNKRTQARIDTLRGFEACFQVSEEIELINAKALLSELERTRAKHEISAPSGGIVESLDHRPGEWVPAGTSLLVLVNARHDRVIAFIPVRQVPYVKPGVKASLKSRDHIGSAVEGEVTAIGARISQVPLRLRFIPTIPEWGRLVTIQVPSGSAVPGEIYNVRFKSP